MARSKNGSSRGSAPQDPYVAAFRDAPSGVAVLSAEAAVLAANPQLGAMLGWRPSELAGQPFAQLIEERIHPDGAPGLIEAMRAAARAGVVPAAAGSSPPDIAPVHRREICLHAAYGGMVWTLLRWTAGLPGPDGAPVLAVYASELAADRDPQEATHELGELVARLVAASRFAVAVVSPGPDGRILQANQELCELLGYSEPELTGKSFREITHPGDWDKTESYVLGMAQWGEDRHQMIKRYLAKDGRVLYCRRVLYASRGRDGTLRSLVLIIEPRGTG